MILGEKHAKHVHVHDADVEAANASETQGLLGEGASKLSTRDELGFCRYHLEASKFLFFENRLNWLMLFLPVAIASKLNGWSDGYNLVLCVVTMIPFAAIVGFLTEELAEHTNDTFGGFLNATFGNAAELIISLFALRHGLLLVVQVSLLGSVLSNLLLVLGTSLFVGGLRYKVQSFNKTVAAHHAGLLMVAVMGMLFPAVLHAAQFDDLKSELQLSVYTSFMLLGTYVAYLYFQLKTHNFLFEGLEVPVEESDSDPLTREANLARKEDKQEEEEKEFEFTVPFLVASLAVATVAISLLSEWLVSSIEAGAEALNIPKIFIGAIVIPIVGNAAEHVSAVTCAYHNKIEITLGIAIGSSTQIALFVTPLMVVISWLWGMQLGMNFHIFETAVVFCTVLLVTVLCNSGKTTWLTGAMLVVAYFLVAGGFFVLQNHGKADANIPEGDLEDRRLF